MANTRKIVRSIKEEFERNIIGNNPFGTTWFVDATNGNSGYSGLESDRAKATIAQAIAAGSAGDTVVLSPETHSVDVSAAALIPLANMRFIGALPTYGGYPSAWIVADADDGADLITIDVDGVEFRDIGFKLVAGGTTALRLVSIAQTTAVKGCRFLNCWFDLNSVDAASVYAMALNDATNAITGLAVKGCTFLGGDATTATTNYIQIGVGGCPNCVFEYNVYMLESADGDANGFDFLDPGTSAKSYGIIIRNNDFIGPSDGGGDAVGIVFAAAMTEDEIVGMIRTNFFSNCTAAVTVDKVNNSIINNYEGDNATGGTLVDPGT